MKFLQTILFATLLVVTLICGCAVQGERTDGHNTDAADVKLLFEADGVKVYRFMDLGIYRYYAVDRTGHVVPVTEK